MKQLSRRFTRVKKKPIDCCLPSLGLFFGLVVVLVSFGCRRAESPDATLTQIRKLMGQGQLDAALHDVDAALAKYQEGNSEWAARFRVQKAHILMFRGSYSESLQLLDKPLPFSISRSDTEVQRRMVQGLAHDFLQQFEDADKAISEAEGLATTINSSLLGEVSQARGILEMDRKNYTKAEAAYRAAAVFARQHGQLRAEMNALGSLGNVAMWQEHYDEAIERFKTVQQSLESLKSGFALNRTLGNLGWSYLAIGDFYNAEIEFKAAEAASAKAGMSEDRAYWLQRLGDAYYRQGRYAEAEAVSKQALVLEGKMDDKRTLTECLNTLSEIALATGHLDEAEKHNEEALGIERVGLDKFGVAASTIIAGRISASKKHYAEAEKAFQKIIDDPGSGTPLRWEAQAGIAEVSAAQGKTSLAEQQFLGSIGTITNAWNGLQQEEFRLSFLSSAIRFYGAYVDFLIAERRPLDALRIADLSRAQTLERGLASSANGAAHVAAKQFRDGQVRDGQVKNRRVQGQIQAAAFRPQETARRLNATLLFYWLGEQSSHLWVITPGKVSLLPLPGREEIDSTVRSYLSVFPDPKDPLEAGNADGKKLYVTLIEPAEKLMPKNSRVVILPDGGLNSLNFETLIASGDRPHYWIEDVTLLTANSLALLAKASPAAPPGDASLFLMGDALQASPDFPPLPQAGKEVGLVQNYFPAGRRSVLTAAQATPSAFLSGKPEEFSYLHFATHGTASTLRPLESAVVLSPEGDAYKLYARDIVHHPVHAYLVTISACNGAGMKTYAGEGLVGLAWAFLRAGAHNVIGGLWEVSNASTPQLMNELYKGLNEGKDPATALRNAKLTLVHSTGNYHRPYYWGPFQLYAGS